MGTLGGHILPGSFFIIFGIWWSFITAIRFTVSKNKSPFKKNSLIGYKGTATMPCICLPSKRMRTAPIESILKIFFGSVGLLGEVITGISYSESPKPDLSNMNMMSHTHEHLHRRDLNSNVPSLPVKSIQIAYNNLQHITMYSIFILGAIVEVLIYQKFNLPARLDYILGIIAFTIEAFIFYSHSKGHEGLEMHVHTLLVFAIFGCIVMAVLETYKPNEIMFTYGRTMFTILQGKHFTER
jgi:hypothetical protein